MSDEVGVVDSVEKVKQTRVRCDDESFLNAVFSSKTLREVAEKTGQKIATTTTRYNKAKKMLAEQGIELPSMERSKPAKSVDKNAAMADIALRLKQSYGS
mgnify:CR=1 FL=1